LFGLWGRSHEPQPACFSRVKVTPFTRVRENSARRAREKRRRRLFAN
jgi:hypothetical protein